jgi:hypothetical protein
MCKIITYVYGEDCDSHPRDIKEVRCEAYWNCCEYKCNYEGTRYCITKDGDKCSNIRKIEINITWRACNFCRDQAKEKEKGKRDERTGSIASRYF